MSKANIKNIAYGLLGTFVSRNNDIGGYWGLGVLRLFAEQNLMTQLTIDALDQTPGFGFDSPISKTEERYRTWLLNSLIRSKVDLNEINQARIELYFSTFEEFPEVVRDARGQPYKCTVSIAHRNGKLYCASKLGVCAPHDPQKDRRSVRESI